MGKTLIMVGALSAALALTACSADQTPTAGAPAGATSATATSIGSAVDRALDRASEKLRTENITVSNHAGSDALPKAQITPQGDLLVGAKAVPVTADQRKMLLDYRAQLVAIATQGIAIGKQGAALGVRAAEDAIAGAFSGQSDAQVRQQVEARTAGIKQSAATLCGRLPGLMASQRQLAAALPAFKPYATMTAHDIHDCRDNVLKDEAPKNR